MSGSEGLSFEDFDMDIDSISDPRISNPELSLKQAPKLQSIHDFFKEIVQRVERNYERILAIIDNINNSKLLEQTPEAKVFHGHLANLKRDIQNTLRIEVQDLNEKLKEMINKPKNLEAYTIQYSAEKIQLLSGMITEREKLERIFSWEMDKKVETGIQAMKKVATLLFTFFSELSDKNVLEGINKKQELVFEDSKSLCLIIFDELEEIRNKIDERNLYSE